MHFWVFLVPGHARLLAPITQVARLVLHSMLRAHVAFVVTNVTVFSVVNLALISFQAKVNEGASSGGEVRVRYFRVLPPDRWYI